MKSFNVFPSIAEERTNKHPSNISNTQSSVSILLNITAHSPQPPPETLFFLSILACSTNLVLFLPFGLLLLGPLTTCTSSAWPQCPTDPPFLTSLGDFIPSQLALCSSDSQFFFLYGNCTFDLQTHIIHSPPLSLDVSWGPQTKGFQNDFPISQHVHLSAFPILVNDTISRQKPVSILNFSLPLSLQHPPLIQSIRNPVNCHHHHSCGLPTIAS